MTTPGSSAGDGGRPPSSSWTWLLPVLTFLVGCLLGGVVVAAGAFDGDDDQVAAPSTTSSPEPGDGAEPSPTPSDLVVRVPESCLRAAEAAAEASRQFDDVVAAVRDLDARRLQELVDRVQQAQPEAQRLAEQCRSVAGERLLDVDVTPTPAPTPTPSS